MKWFEKHYNISLAITILIAIFIFYMSSRTFEMVISTTSGLQWKTTVYHFTIFFLLSTFISTYLVRGKSSRKRLIIIGVIVSSIYAISDEIHQLFVPGRFCSITDVLIDFLGIILAGIIYLKLRTNPKSAFP